MTLTAFIILNVVNVIIGTGKSILLVKGNRWQAAFMSALDKGIYTVILLAIATADIDGIAKVLVSAACTFIGVFIAKTIEQHFAKDKLWKIELTVRKEFADDLKGKLDECGIANSYDKIGSHTRFACYAYTKEESSKVHSLGKQYNAKFFISESVAQFI